MLTFKYLRLKRPLAVIDLESTGTNPWTDRIVQIAALRFEPQVKPVAFTRLINPGVSVPPAARAVHGLGDAELAACPAFAKVARRLARFLKHCDLAGYGIKRFDLPLLVAEFSRAGVAFSFANRAVVDAMEIFPPTNAGI